MFIRVLQRPINPPKSSEKGIAGKPEEETKPCVAAAAMMTAGAGLSGFC